MWHLCANDFFFLIYVRDKKPRMSPKMFVLHWVLIWGRRGHVSLRKCKFLGDMEEFSLIGVNEQNFTIS